MSIRQWSAGVVRSPEKAKTGTTKRMKHLPVVTHQPTDYNHPPDSNDNIVSIRNETKECLRSRDSKNMTGKGMNQREGRSSTRSVYHYEDRYRFSRVITENDLQFDSHFESGNLMRAWRITKDDDSDQNENFQEYDLELHHDLYSVGHAQWFYFSCTNTIEGREVKFNLTNFTKKDSLFNHGMKPLMLSKKMSSLGVGWKREGDQICYYANGKKKGKKEFYTLTFKIKFEYSGDCCFFAFAYPYTFTDLQNRLLKLQFDHERKTVFRRHILCKTLSGNNCDILTITEPSDDWQCMQKRLGVVITARVHPGESSASWICDGIIKFLTGTRHEARILRNLFVFKIVPMLNPDGVINGNYRTNMAGVDLNRCWDSPDERFHPTIYYTKEMVKCLQRCRQVLTVCDIHGHSRKEGVFMYGCSSKDGISVKTPNDKLRKENISVFTLPQILNVKNKSFKLEYCNFSSINYKAPTMRTVMFEELNISYSYSMEASLAGMNGKHFSCNDLMLFGEQYCLSLLDLYHQVTNNSKCKLEYLCASKVQEDGDDNQTRVDKPRTNCSKMRNAISANAKKTKDNNPTGKNICNSKDRLSTGKESKNLLQCRGKSIGSIPSKQNIKKNRGYTFPN